MKTLKNYILFLPAKLIICLTLLLSFSGFSAPVLARTVDPTTGTAAPTTSTTSSTTDNPNCSNSTDAGIQKCIATDPIVKDLNLVVNFLSAGVGIVVIGAIILGGIQYTLAGDNSTATQAAKKRITDALIALVAFIFTFAFLQWIIPGGL